MPEVNRNSLNRREFLSYLTLGWAAFAAAVGGLASLAFRFSYPNVNFDPEMEFNADTHQSMSLVLMKDGKMVMGFGLLKRKESFSLYRIFVPISVVFQTGYLES